METRVDANGRGRFRVVGDDFRSEPDEDPELVKELLAGRTVFLEDYTPSKVGTLYTRMRTRHNKVLRRRSRQVDGAVGYVVWLEDPPPDVPWDDEVEDPAAGT
jgi:hypothetical protein